MLQKIGKYEIVDRIGAGAMGDVYKSFDPMLKRWVALKVFSSNLEVTDELRARFFQEAQAGAMLSHPNIVTVHDLGEQDGYLFIVMELLEGEELRQLITRRKDLSLEQKLALMVQVCSGVEYAHSKGVIHRDIKPGNIFVLTNDRVKLLDFGVARFAAIDTGLTRAGLIMGTVRYMSPEQCRGRADHRSDIFSVGAVAYELLTYRPAFSGDDTFALLHQVQHADPPSLRELDPSIPEDLAAAVHRALRKEPSDRFAAIAEMRAELEQIQQQLREEADQARRRLRASLGEARTLEQALAESAGAAPQAGLSVTVDLTGPLTALQQSDAKLGVEIDRLRSRVEQAHRVEPLLEKASQLSSSEDHDAAIALFERILAQMPEHTRASEGLRHAREERSLRRVRTGIFDPADGLEDRHRHAAESDVTVVDIRARDETVRPVSPSSTKLSDTDVLEALRKQTASADSTGQTLRRASRRRWVVAVALAALLLIAGTYWLNPIALRRSPTGQILTSWKASLYASLADLGITTPTRAGSGPSHSEPAASRVFEPVASRDSVDRRSDSQPVGVAAERGAEPQAPTASTQDAAVVATRAVEPFTPSVPDSAEKPIELPPRSLPPRPDRVPKIPSGRAEEPSTAIAPGSARTVEVHSAPTVLARSTPPSPPAAAPRPPLPALSAEATLSETVAWLTQALTEHSKIGRRPSGAMYQVHHLDGCHIDWRTFNERGAGYQILTVLNAVDPERTSVAQRDGGWTIDLPWANKATQADQESRLVGSESFGGLVVWFAEANTATNAASAFRRAIQLCGR